MYQSIYLNYQKCTYSELTSDSFRPLQENFIHHAFL